jgi:hypothetical protein
MADAEFWHKTADERAAEIARLRETLAKIAMQTSGGLTYFTAEAKHAQLRDIARECQFAGFDVPALGVV